MIIRITSDPKKNRNPYKLPVSKLLQTGDKGIMPYADIVISMTAKTESKQKMMVRQLSTKTIFDLEILAMLTTTGSGDNTTATIIITATGATTMATVGTDLRNSEGTRNRKNIPEAVNMYEKMAKTPKDRLLSHKENNSKTREVVKADKNIREAAIAYVCAGINDSFASDVMNAAIVIDNELRTPSG